MRLLWIVVVLLGLEGVTRLVTWAQFRWRSREFPELRERHAAAREAREALTIGILIDRAAIYPAVFTSDAGEPRVVPFGELEVSDFPSPPAHDEPTPGVVRIAFLGERSSYPALVREQLDAALGPGKVEVVDLGVPGSHSATTALLAERLLPRWRPHLVVVSLGFDDLVFYRGRAQAIARAARREARFEDPGVPVSPASRGLWDLFRLASTDDAPLAWLEDTWITEPMSSYWELERQVSGLGGELWVASVAAPDPGELSEVERRYFALDLELIWPLLGGADTFAADLTAYRAALGTFARTSGAHLIDVAAQVRGGRALFVDNATLTSEGQALQARVVVQALLPRIRELLAVGAPPPEPRVLPEPRPLAPAPAPALEPGRCVQGPCPANTCYVAGGPLRYGNDPSDLDVILARQRAGIGVAEDFWFEDETPELELAVSPFCVDRSEAAAVDHRRCQDAGVCPQTFAADATLEPDAAAIFPTLDDARAYCRFRGGRLPTDVEFDAAARGGDERLMPWGDTWTGVEANFCGAECRFGDPSDASDGFDGPAPIGSFTGVSPTGAIDMAGNLWEWIDECFDSSTHRRFPAGTLDPIVGPLPECRRFLRGGSYRSYAGVLERRTASGMPDTDIPTRGARCVFDFGTVHQVIEQERGGG